MISVALLMSVMAGASEPEPAAGKTVMVLPFDDGAVKAKVARLAGRPLEIGRDYRALLISKMAGTFRVLERGPLSEIGSGPSFERAGRAVQPSRMPPHDFDLFGDITELAFETGNDAAGKPAVKSARMTVTYRVVEGASRAIVLSGKVTETGAAGQLHPASGGWEETLMGQAAKECAGRIAAAMKSELERMR